jgi:hypothetical protein
MCNFLLLPTPLLFMCVFVSCNYTWSFAAAEREAVSAAEKAERKVQLRDKVSYSSYYASADRILPFAVLLIRPDQAMTKYSLYLFQKRKEEMERLEKEKQAEIRSYKGLMVQDKMTSNKQVASGSKTLQELEEDFM